MILATSFSGDLFTGILQGLPPGTVYGLIAIGFVLAYKTSGVFNLAFAAQAYASAAVFYVLRKEHQWNLLEQNLVLDGIEPLCHFRCDPCRQRHVGKPGRCRLG